MSKIKLNQGKIRLMKTPKNLIELLDGYRQQIYRNQHITLSRPKMASLLADKLKRSFIQVDIEIKRKVRKDKMFRLR